jgi:tetratricopeptide (TPR) repeat protein
MGMMEERENYWDDEILEAVNRFKRSLISGSTKYFDVAEFEGIVEQLLEEGDLQGSEIAAEQGIKIHPNAVPLQLKYAQILINKGLYEKSLIYLQIAEEVDSKNPDVHLLKGSAQMVMGNETDALLSFRKAIKYAGVDIDEILYQIGSTYVQVGNIPKAIYYFEKTVRANPFNDLALYDLGFFYDQENKLKKSVRYYNKYLDIDPFNQYVWFNLGTVYNKMENHGKAIEAYEFAHALNDNFHMALFNIGNALANDERYQEAIDKYKEFLLVEPDNDEAFCYIGECYLNIEDYIQAQYYYNRAIEINKNNDTAWFGIGLILWIEQNFEASIKFIKKAIKLDELNSEYWLTIGKIYKDFNHKADAVSSIKKAARIEPENIEIWLTWADVYLRFEEPENAVRILRKGIEKNGNAILKYRLVALMLELKQQKEAYELLSYALMQDFEQVEFLFEINPKLQKNRKLNKMVADFKPKKIK